MRQVTAQDPISIDEVRRLAEGRFGDMVKGVVDVAPGVMLLDADLRADQEAALLAEGSAQRSGASTSIPTSTAPTGWSSTR